MSSSTRLRNSTAEPIECRYLDEELDPARLTIALSNTAESLARFFQREPAEWGRDLASSAKRDAALAELELATEIVASMARITRDVASHALTPEDIRVVRAMCGFDRAAVAA